MSRLKAFAGETLIYGFANVFSRVFAMFLIPLYTNYLGKVDYSNLIMLQSLFTLLSFALALNSGVFYYFYEYEKSRYKQIVFTSWFYYQLGIALIISSLLYLSSSYLKDLFIINEVNHESITTALILIGIQLFPYIINITNINLYRVRRKPKPVMLIVFLESLFTLIFVGGGLLFFEFGIVEIFGSQIAARLLVALIFYKTASFYLNLWNFSLKMVRKLLHFSWPFFIISSFSWLIISVDKFIGVESLQNKEDVAILALAMQLTIPIMILADMIRMAIGPFIMSIRKEEGADHSYQRIFDLSVFSSSILLVGLVVATPLAVFILANETFLKVLYVVPLIAFASVLSLMYNQLAIAFSLSKKNAVIMYATVAGGMLGFFINKYFMYDYGFIVSGISQVFAYSLMIVILYILGKKMTDTELSLRNSAATLLINLLFFIGLYLNITEILNGKYVGLILLAITAFFIHFWIFSKLQNLSVSSIWNRFKNVRK